MHNSQEMCKVSLVVLQGRVACEVNSGDELAATELIFGGVLTQLSPEEAVAVLSALVFQVCHALLFVTRPALWQSNGMLSEVRVCWTDCERVADSAVP